MSHYTILSIYLCLPAKNKVWRYLAPSNTVHKADSEGSVIIFSLSVVPNLNFGFLVWTISNYYYNNRIARGLFFRYLIIYELLWPLASREGLSGLENILKFPQDINKSNLLWKKNNLLRAKSIIKNSDLEHAEQFWEYLKKKTLLSQTRNEITLKIMYNVYCIQTEWTNII